MRATFPPSRRLTHKRQFEAVFEARMRVSQGPIAVFGCRNGLPYARLGLSVGKPVGHAPARNRAKRVIRESFRLLQHDIPVVEPIETLGGLDLIVSVKPHTPREQAWYQETLRSLVQQLHERWQRRERRGDTDAR